MSMYVPEGASLPSGIEVDETAAYFGITGSSNLLLNLNSMSRFDALKSVLERISDLLLTGSFDLDVVSERLEVESGEIYYILTGPLDLLGVTQDLREFLGLGEKGGAPPDDISIELLADLEALLDPMELLRIYAVGDIVGGADELNKYMVHLESMLAAPAENIDDLVTIHRQMKEIMVETMQMSMPRSIEVLAQKPTPATLPAPAPAQPHVQELQTPTQPQQQSPAAMPTQIPQPLQEPTPEPAEHSVQPSSDPVPAPASDGSAPLIEAKPLQRPVIVEHPPQPAGLDQTSLASIEDDALNTAQWMKKPKVRDMTTPTEPGGGGGDAGPGPQPSPLQPVQTPTLPRPVQPAKKKSPDGGASNGIARTFPEGRLCSGCGVSQSGSWRYCALCGRSA